MAYETQRAALAGVVAIPVTPFAEDGGVERDTAAVTVLLCALASMAGCFSAAEMRLRPSQ